MRNYIRFFIGVVWLSISSFAFSVAAQQDITAIRDSSQRVSFDKLASKIEQNYQIRLYYEPSWFEGRLFNAAIADLPLEESLLRIKRLMNLSFVEVNKTSFVFIPVQVSNFSVGTGSTDIILVGNLNEYGKYSKANINGKVLDGKTGEPLIGAIVSIPKAKYVTATDKNGGFNAFIPVGEYELKISYIGYEDNSRSLKIVSNGTANLELFEKSVKIKEVTITSDLAEFNVTRTQMSVLRLDAKNIKELPVSLGEKDIIKSVSLLPGVLSTGEFGTGFFVRGGSSDQNLILIGDVPVFNSSHVFGLNSIINPDGVTGVTLIKAGIPARFGERVSSVMDIRIGSTAEQLTAKGGIGLLNSRICIESPLFHKKASLLVGARSSYSNWLLHKMPDIDLMNSSAGFYDLNALFTMNFNPKNRITLFGYFSDDKFSFSKTMHYHYSNLLASVRYAHIFNKYLSSGFLIGTSQYKYDIIENDSLKRKEAYRINSQITYHSLKWDFLWHPNDFHSIDFGVNSVLYRIQPGELLPFNTESEVISRKIQSEKGLEMAAYISDNISFTTKISMETGLRFTRYAYLGPGNIPVFTEDGPKTLETLIGTQYYKNNQVIKWYSGIEPRLAFRYSLNENSSLKLSYNKINQFISLISNTTIMTPTDVWKLSTPNLKPLTCVQYAAGYFRNFDKNTFEASAEVYYKTLKNVIDFKEGASILLNELLETELVNASGYNYGIELYIKKNSGRFTGWASYTYSKSKRHTSSSSVIDQINGNRDYPSTFDQPHNLVLLGNYHMSRRWRFSGTFTFCTGRPVTLPEIKYFYNGFQFIYYSERNKYRMPDYHRLDIAITLEESLRLKKKWKGNWTFSIINLYGRKNAYSIFYKKEALSNFNDISHRYNLYKLFIIGRPLPTLTYNFTF